jgi:hypothetical protein
MRLIYVGVALLATTGLLFNSLTESAVAQRFNPKNRGLPGRRQGGGTRGECVTQKAAVTAIMPIDNFGVTVSDRPTIYWSVNSSEIKQASIVILNDKNEEVYAGDFAVPAKSGLMSFTLPKQAKPLTVGKSYYWRAAMICDQDDLSGSVVTEGWMRRDEMTAGLQQKLNAASPEQRSTILATAGNWYEQVAESANLQQTQPNNASIQANWQALLKSVELNNLVASAPSPAAKIADIKTAPPRKQ